MGLYDAGFLRASVRLAGVLVTACAGKRLGDFFWNGKSSVVRDTIFNAILGKYDIMHLYCSIAGCTYHHS